MTQTNAQASPTVALTSTWLDTTATAATPSFTANLSNLNACAGVNTSTYVWPHYQPGVWWYPYEGPARPIRLGLSEIARLKAAAKRDAKLKVILAKFTDLIEVAVDFE